MYVFELSVPEVGRALPSGWSMFEPVIESPLPREKLARMVVDWPTKILVESAVMVAVGLEGAETFKMVGQENALPLCPTPEPE